MSVLCGEVPGVELGTQLTGLSEAPVKWSVMVVTNTALHSIRTGGRRADRAGNPPRWIDRVSLLERRVLGSRGLATRITAA